MFRASLFVALPLAALLAGCRTEQQLSYQEAYAQKLYPQALEKATPIANDEHAADRQRAALIAGMSAQSMGQNVEARKWLAPLRLSPDRDIAARARATLGLVAKAEGKAAEAATLLAGSAETLDGDDAARAKIHAGDAYRQIGLEKQARQEYQGATSEAEDPALKAAAAQKARPMGYFVQCGAYSTRQAADKQVKAIKPQVAKAGQPAPMVIQMAPNGTPLFVVQIGPYHDKQQAMSAKARMNLASAAITARQ
ncbi:MAG TPA: SPOR domain-containing protein [Phycisphaerales bacterium]|nr:SPOR domain-containing protein [Phycisphaerales bacterium]